MKLSLAIVIALCGLVYSASAEPLKGVQKPKDDAIVRLLKRTTPPGTLTQKERNLSNRVQLVRLLTPRTKKAMPPVLSTRAKPDSPSLKSSTLIRVDTSDVPTGKRAHQAL